MKNICCKSPYSGMQGRNCSSIPQSWEETTTKKIKLNKQSFLMDIFPLLLFLQGIVFCSTLRIREHLKDNFEKQFLIWKDQQQLIHLQVCLPVMSVETVIFCVSKIYWQYYLKFESWHQTLICYHKISPKQINILNLVFQHPGSWLSACKEM